MFYLIFGVLVGGAVMYYIQPTIKLWVAKAFGAEQKLYDDYQSYAMEARVSAVQKANEQAAKDALETKKKDLGL